MKAEHTLEVVKEREINWRLKFEFGVGISCHHVSVFCDGMIRNFIADSSMGQELELTMDISK